MNVIELNHPELLQKRYTDMVQEWMDKTVQERNYDDVFTCISYVNSTDETFRAEAQAVLEWRDKVWRKCYTELNRYQAGERELPIDIIAELPKLEW